MYLLGEIREKRQHAGRGHKALDFSPSFCHSETFPAGTSKKRTGLVW